MATGDMLFFEEALEYVLNGGWEKKVNGAILI